MATIKIRGRRDPIEVSDERGKKLKNQKFGFNGIAKADPSTPVDLGDIWCGALSQIESIEIEGKSKSAAPQEYVRGKIHEYNRWWQKLTPEQKGAQVHYLKLQWQMAKGGSREETIPEDVLEAIIEVRTEYFRKNPDAFYCPLSELDKAFTVEKQIPVEEMEKALKD